MSASVKAQERESTRHRIFDEMMRTAMAHLSAVRDSGPIGLPLIEPGCLDSELSDQPLDAQRGFLPGKEWYRILTATQFDFGEWLKIVVPHLEDGTLDDVTEAKFMASSNGVAPPAEVDKAIRQFLRVTNFFYTEASKQWLKRNEHTKANADNGNRPIG
jgi:hypothetical protein